MILAAHGSRLKSSNEEVTQLAAKLGDQLTSQFAQVEPAFLELSPPSIEQAIATCVAAGHHHITVVPYFLAAGRHVKDDVPAIVEQARQQYPDVDIELTQHLGLSDGLVSAVTGLLDSNN
ncbi:CbiX/SirB N-terminal domain-containing protein [Neiella sp. HB171785]|uniref:CbiX/SirB N-terminal domain-containing protein n=2 Tax=Neiella litorisoli TaxID=2771431 RepID=A0A8J6QJY1_9GAMM|nr:CbiX/SirB N-terminal domain-containing protein [Neiella litorisoli]